MILHRILPLKTPWRVIRSIIIITSSPFSLNLPLLLLLHSRHILLLLPIGERTGEQRIFLGACWKLMNGVDSDLEVELQEQGWIGLCMMSWRRLDEVGPVVLPVLVVRWMVQVILFYLLPFFPPT